MSGEWPMSGYDAGKRFWNPNGVSIRGDPELLTPVTYAEVSPGDVSDLNIPPRTPVIDGNLLYFNFNNCIIAYDFDRDVEVWRSEYGLLNSSLAYAEDEIFAIYESGLGDSRIISADTEMNPHYTYSGLEASRATGRIVITEHDKDEAVSSLNFYSIVDGTLYTQTRGFESSKEWSFNEEKEIGEGVTGGPLVDSEIVVVWNRETVYGLDEEDGTVKWLYDRRGDPEPSLISEGRLICGGNPKIEARDLEDGSKVWTSPVEADYVAATDEEIISIYHHHSSDSCKISSVSLEDGSLNWETEWVADTESDGCSVTGPVISGDTVLVEFGTERVYLLTDGGYYPERYYGREPGVNIGELRAFDIKTGDELWRVSLPDRPSFFGATEERIYVFQSNGTIQAIVDGETTDVDEDDRPKLCSDCGQIHQDWSPSWRYCSMCGAEL
jgi:outer membrane protein assembly factor BamB